MSAPYMLRVSGGLACCCDVQALMAGRCPTLRLPSPSRLQVRPAHSTHTDARHTPAKHCRFGATVRQDRYLRYLMCVNTYIASNHISQCGVWVV